MDLNPHPTPFDASACPEVDGELTSQIGADGRVQVEVIEHLRVKVPAAARQAWLEAEQVSWEPWLRAQAGFLGRRLHWDGQHEEGHLLIRWASRAQWHAIPRAEIEQVQERFERQAHAALRRWGVLPPGDDPAPLLPGCSRPANPFPLLSSGELPPEAMSRELLPPAVLPGQDG